MRILILIIYSDNNAYKEMLNIQRTYLHNYNVTSYFITMRNQQQNIEIENDFIFVKGIESYFNILDKTIKALEYIFNREKYDFVIRSNMSTIINIPKLLLYLNTIHPENFYAGHITKLKWLDPENGIIDKSLWGTKYAGGTNIILSNDIVQFLLLNKNNVRHDIVDDVAIGLFITTYLKNVKFVVKNRYLVKNISDNINYNYLFYRNRQNIKSIDRIEDIITMKKICQKIYF